MVLMCGALFWGAAHLTGMVIKTPTPAEDAPTYGHRQIFPILTQQDRTDCLARPFWWIASIKVSDETTVYECRPQ
jgi:hypothetical protein